MQGDDQVPDNIPHVEQGGQEEEDIDFGYESETDGEDSVQDIHFSDSEEERAVDKDDGFQNNNIGIAESLLNEQLRKMQGGTYEIAGSGPSVILGDADGGTGLHSDHEMENAYDSEDLGSVSGSDDDDMLQENRNFTQFHEEDMREDFKFQLGMEFRSLKQFKDAVRDHTVLNGRQIRTVKNDGIRYRIKCRREDCAFVMLCSKVGGKATFSIKTMIGPHTCPRVFNNKSASSKWVAKKLTEKVRNSRKLRLTDVQDEVKVAFCAGITRWRAWKGRQMAMEIVEGDASRQYHLLYRFSAELISKSRGNTCKIGIERFPGALHPRFQRFYMCLEGCKKGFVEGCRPFIGLDGCHLKTQFGGILLCAVARDPNDQYFPLAFAVVESECKESWRWFLEILLDDIGADRRWIFISDQQKVKCQFH